MRTGLSYQSQYIGPKRYTDFTLCKFVKKQLLFCKTALHK